MMKLVILQQQTEAGKTVMKAFGSPKKEFGPNQKMQNRQNLLQGIGVEKMVMFEMVKMLEHSKLVA